MEILLLAGTGKGSKSFEHLIYIYVYIYIYFVYMYICIYIYKYGGLYTSIHFHKCQLFRGRVYNPNLMQKKRTFLKDSAFKNKESELSSV